MAADSGQIVARIGRMHEDFRRMIELVTGPTAAEHTAAEMELRLFRQLLAMGLQLLELFIVAGAASKPPDPVDADGSPLTECHRRSTTYLSVFGKVRFKAASILRAGPEQCRTAGRRARIASPLLL